MSKIRILHDFCKDFHLLSTIHDSMHNFCWNSEFEVCCEMSIVGGARLKNSCDMQMLQYRSYRDTV